MKIVFSFVEKKRYSVEWLRNVKVLMFSLWKFRMAICVGKFNPKAEYKKMKDRAKNAFDKKCKVCGKPLNVNSIGQIVFYHKECRKFRLHPDKYVPTV